MLCLPTYVLPLPLEVAREVATYLLHPNTIVQRYTEMQRQYISARIQHTKTELELQYDNYNVMNFLSAWYILERIQRCMYRKPSPVISILKLTSQVRTEDNDSIYAHIQRLTKQGTCPPTC